MEPTLSPKPEKRFSMDSRLMNALKFVLVIVAVFAGILLGLRLILFLLPFALAFLFAQILNPLISFLEKKLPIKRSILSVILTILFYAIFVFLAVLLVGKIWSEINSLKVFLQQPDTDLMEQINRFISKLQSNINAISPSIGSVINPAIENGINAIIESLRNVKNWNWNWNFIGSTIISSASAVSTFIFSAIIMIVSTVFFASGKETIAAFFQKQFPDTWMGGVTSVRNDLFGAFFGYIKAQLKIMSIVFVEMLIGFLIINPRYAILLALITAIVDALPIFGAGFILWPSIAWGLINQDYRFAAGCAILYVCTLILRQSLEPRMLSNEIGLYPLVTLLAMYCGFQFFGMIGLIIGPIVTLVAKNLIAAYMAGRTVSEVIDGAPPKPKLLDEEIKKAEAADKKNKKKWFWQKKEK